MVIRAIHEHVLFVALVIAASLAIVTRARACRILPLTRVTQSAFRVVCATIVEPSLALLTFEAIVGFCCIVAAPPLALVARIAFYVVT